MNDQKEYLLVFHKLEYTNDQKLELLNKLITGQPSTDDLFKYYTDRVQIYYDMREYQAAINDINAMEQLKKIQDHIQLLKWKSLIHINFGIIREEIRTSISVNGYNRCKADLLRRINEDNISKLLEDDEERRTRKRKRD